MPRLTLEKILRLTLAVGLTGAALSELSGQRVVTEGLAALGYPSWLVLLLGPAKLAAVLALVLRPHTRLAAAAYAGLLVNLGGAVASMALARVALWPDVVIAPTYLLLVAASAALHERARVAASRIGGAHAASPPIALSAAALVVVGALSSSAPASASSEPLEAVGQSADAPTSRLASLELNVVWPFVPGVGIWQARAGVRLWQASSLRGELLIAANVRPPVWRDHEGDFAE